MSTRWFEFRHGYTTYMTFLFGFSNFILILYNFVPQVKQIIDLHFFAIIIFSVIVPTAVFVGRWHHRKHLPTESRVAAKHNAYRDKIVPDSKENFQTKHAIFTNDYSKWQLEMFQKQMRVMNAMMDKLGVPQNLRYNDNEISSAKYWDSKLNLWRSRLERYNSGESASDLVKE